MKKTYTQKEKSFISTSIEKGMGVEEICSAYQKKFKARGGGTKRSNSAISRYIYRMMREMNTIEFTRLPYSAEEAAFIIAHKDQPLAEMTKAINQKFHKSKDKRTPSCLKVKKHQLLSKAKKSTDYDLKTSINNMHVQERLIESMVINGCDSNQIQNILNSVCASYIPINRIHSLLIEIRGHDGKIDTKEASFITRLEKDVTSFMNRYDAAFKSRYGHNIEGMSSQVIKVRKLCDMTREILKNNHPKSG